MADAMKLTSRGPAGQALLPGRTHHWFVTAHTVRHRVQHGASVEWPMSIAHAKRMGMNATACGLATTTWTKLFHLPFPVPRAENCRACWAMIARAGDGG
jgi:hypothetical protein